MNRFVTCTDFFAFLQASEQAYDISGESYLYDINRLSICPANNVPNDDLPYMVFVGRTARDPLALLMNTAARLVVVDKNIELPSLGACCVVRVENSRLFFCELLSFISAVGSPHISDLASICPSARIGRRALIGDHVTVGENVIIGNDCKIANGVTILDDVQIGDRVNIYPGAVIGTDGFGYEKRKDGSYVKFPHIGRVVIGSDVDIGANSVIDRGTLGATIIGDGVKIDNLVHISHNVSIGDNSVVIANAMVAGGVSIGRGSWIGPSSNVLDQVSVGQDSFVGMGVSVIKDLPVGSRFTLKNFLRFFLEK